jgi:hypothetical protein
LWLVGWRAAPAGGARASPPCGPQLAVAVVAVVAMSGGEPEPQPQPTDDHKRWAVIYPAYLDATKTIALVRSSRNCPNTAKPWLWVKARASPTRAVIVRLSCGWSQKGVNWG